VTYNSAHVVAALLDSLPAALDGLAYRTVVVDNGSSDNTLDVLRARRDCTVIAAANRGYSAGFNAGVAASPGTGPVLILNPDAVLEPRSVRTLVEALALPHTGIAAPKILNADGSLQPSMRREPTLLRAVGLGFTGRAAFAEYVREPSRYERGQVVDWAVGAMLLISRQCLADVGAWDESFFLYSEETDFCLRARDRGWLTRYVPDAVVVHVGGQSGQSARIHSMQIINRVRLYRRRHALAPASVYFALSVASELSWLVRGHTQSLTAVRALVSPRKRPAELRCSDHLIPF
jgi:N-acetylglucosaminyl-diphospho-decaprenol L-rhamnosyltransferase